MEWSVTEDSSLGGAAAGSGGLFVSFVMFSWRDRIRGGPRKSVRVPDKEARGSARAGVFDDHGIGWWELQGCGAFQIGLGMRLAVLNVAGGDEVMHEVPDTGGAEADFGQIARGGSDDNALRRRYGSEKFAGAGESDDVGNVFDFGAKHPEGFLEMDFGAFLGKKILDGGATGAAVGKGGDVDGIHVGARGPAGPDAGDGGRGIDEDAVHVNQQAAAEDVGHKRKIVA